MKRFRVIISPGAQRELLAIRDYIAADAPERAIEYYDFLLDEIRELAVLPRRFPILLGVKGLGREIRYRTVGSYLVIFAVRDRSLYVLKVRHGGRRNSGLSLD